MGMFKHANQWFPGDRVRRNTAEKTASAVTGSILDVDNDMGLARVEWNDGTTGLAKVEELENA